VDQDDRAFLREQLDWIGELALTSREAKDLVPGGAETRAQVLRPAYRTFIVMIAAVIGGIVLGFCGFVVLVFFLVQAAKGKLRSAIRTGLPHAGVYAETFAWWMVAYLGLSLIASQVAPEIPRLVRGGVAMLASLGVLFWPRLRGIPWAQIRRDIGWTTGRQPWLEPFLGIGTYLISLPLLGVGVLFTMAILFVQRLLLAQFGAEEAGNPFSGSSTPIQPHPIFEYLFNGDWQVWLQVIFLASVVAPLVEETMFRGVLYRQVREATRRLPTGLSIFVSGLIVSFIFAILHPTGLPAVPLLMALAFGFTLAREWRGTLIPCMIAHGLSNGIVTTLAILVLGG
jgi:membrane protease YdiL (CAAX protease family)